MKVKFVGFGGYLDTPCYEDENGNCILTIIMGTMVYVYIPELTGMNIMIFVESLALW